ncbi:MAG: ATP-binding cassette domain-containing protein, partial [Pseudorhodoplanes sp.]|nr:ATP-binding cassette domain-containing protein [Pseudorhodoplanes sp.]
LSIEDNLRLGAWTRRDAEIAADIDDVYETFPILREKRSVPAGGLSGGQQQMLAIGRALMARPKLMLLDEPSMGLAPLIVDQIFEIIAGLKRRGITVLLVEQNAYAALAIADRGYVMETGRIALSGTGRELLEDSKVRSAYLGV